MVIKYLCIGILASVLFLQSSTICSAENSSKKLQQPIAITTDLDTNVQDSILELEYKQEEFKLQQEQLKFAEEELKKAQDQLKKQQEKLKSDQEQLRKAQEQLKADQQKKLDSQSKLTKLYSGINSSTYLNYLKKLGYYKNIYKNNEKLNIRNTLLLFQSNHNMSVTGKWDDATKTMLISRLLSLDFKYLDTVKKAPTKGKWIVINKTKRTLTLYEGAKVIKKYAVAVGNPSSLTTSGKFTITSKLIDPYWGGGGFAEPVKGGIPENPLGSRWLGINRKDGSYGIHGTNSFNSIGTYASHGCIRMQNYCVEELFPLVPMKSNVWIGTQTELKNWGVIQNSFQLN